jgi:UDP-3-O-[3-hydroxymyristoyl] glucosamine N-acyltransferase
MTFTIKEIAETVGGKVIGDELFTVSGVSDIDGASREHITFAVKPIYFKKAINSNAGAVLCSEDYGLTTKKPLIVVPNPRFSFAVVLGLFKENSYSYSGIHPTCIKGDHVHFSDNVIIYPNVYIGNNVKIGKSTVIYPGVHIGNNVIIGDFCIIYPNVVILDMVTAGNNIIIHPGAVIGSDGFGFERNGKTYYKIPQIGSVLIEDDVEIGSNTCIDRATTGVTTIGKGTKIDNLVQVAHNVSLGENIVIAGLSGLSGSVKVEDNVVIAGQVGIADRITVGKNALLSAKSGIINDVSPDSKVAGYPAVDYREFFRSVAYVKKIGHICSDIKTMREELLKLKNCKKKHLEASHDCPLQLKDCEY